MATLWVERRSAYAAAAHAGDPHNAIRALRNACRGGGGYGELQGMAAWNTRAKGQVGMSDDSDLRAGVCPALCM